MASKDILEIALISDEGEYVIFDSKFDSRSDLDKIMQSEIMKMMHFQLTRPARPTKTGYEKKLERRALANAKWKSKQKQFS